MFETKLRTALSNALEAGGTSSAQDLLYQKAESYVARAEAAGEDSDFFSIYENRAQLLLFLAYLLPQLVAMEKKISAERKEIKKLNEQLLSAMANLREYLEKCYTLAEAIIDHDEAEQYSRWWTAAPAPFYVGRRNSTGPIAYLYSFFQPPASPFLTSCAGRPNTHKTIESEGYGEWPFMDLVYRPQSQQYLRYCFEAVKLAQLNALVIRGRGRSALKAFHAVKSAKQELLSMDVVDKMLGGIRELDMRRREVYLKVEREILMIDRYYDDLRPCEETWSWNNMLPPSLGYSPFAVDIYGNSIHCMTSEMKHAFLLNLVGKTSDASAGDPSSNFIR